MSPGSKCSLWTRTQNAYYVFKFKMFNMDPGPMFIMDLGFKKLDMYPGSKCSIWTREQRTRPTSAVDAGGADARIVPPRTQDLIQDLFLLLPEVYLRVYASVDKNKSLPLKSDPQILQNI